MTEPYDVVLALRASGGFESPEAVQTWLMTPNPDCGGARPVVLMQRGQYDAVIFAVEMRTVRRTQPAYVTLDA